MQRGRDSRRLITILLPAMGLLAACASSLGDPTHAERTAVCDAGEVKVCRGRPTSRAGEQDFDFCTCELPERIGFD